MKPVIRYAKLVPDAPDINVDFKENAGIDLYAAWGSHFFPTDTGEFVSHVTTSYVFQLPPGVHAMVAGRSGNAFKRSTMPFYGVIDSSYRGEIVVRLETQDQSVANSVVAKGTAVAQLILLNYSSVDLTHCSFKLVDSVSDLENSSRGASGFGSSGNMV